MPSFSDSAVIFFLALLLFGPKKLPELARQLGKLMGEFRRASNEFRMQMEEELRVADQQEQQKKIAAMQAAAPATPALPENTIHKPEAESVTGEPASVEAASDVTAERIEQLTRELVEEHPPLQTTLPIATSGDLNLMPPSTGLPVSHSPLAPVLEAIPNNALEAVPHNNEPATENPTSEAAHHG